MSRTIELISKLIVLGLQNSNFHSKLMDLYQRYFIRSSSGKANKALNFGSAMLAVQRITNDSIPWKAVTNWKHI